jgi:lysophospholipid acyltransferase (LPLAT)-like uncharacterized protein
MATPNLKQSLLLSLVPPLGALTLRALAATWTVTEAGHAEHSPHARPKEPKIYAVWHEVALAAGFYQNQPLHALASQSFDGELIARALERLGWKRTARGSSSRGGTQGLLELKEFLDQGDHVLLTVDGPRGPRRSAKDGAVKLAKLSGFAVVPVAFVSRPQIRLKSWDRMLIPPPLAKGVFHFGQELRYRKNEGDDRAAELRRLQQGLERVNRAAEGFFKGPQGA